MKVSIRMKIFLPVVFISILFPLAPILGVNAEFPHERFRFSFAASSFPGKSRRCELQSHHCRSKQKCRGAFYPFHGATSFAASSKIE